MTTTEPTPTGPITAQPTPASPTPTAVPVVTDVTTPEKPDYKALAEAAAKGPPTPTVPGNLYFKYAKPDGTEFLGAASSAEAYLRKGFTISGEEEISDLVTYYAEKNKAAAAAATTPTTSTEPTTTTTTEPSSTTPPSSTP